LVGKAERKRQIGKPRRIGRTVLEMELGKQGRDVWIGLIWLRIGSSGGLL